MKRAPLTLLATMLAVALLAAGCADTDKPPEAAPDAGQQPKLLTSLTSVSSAPIDPLGQSAVPERGAGLLHDQPGVIAGPRTFGDEPGISKSVGTDHDPAMVQLLNGKAARFASFSDAILQRIYAQVRIAIKDEDFSRTKLPTDIRAVVITAIMDRNGNLTELIVEQHSGKAKVDNMMIRVCKKAIWFRNPPAEALTGDGSYKLMVSAKFENFASSDEHHWSYITTLGLGIG